MGEVGGMRGILMDKVAVGHQNFQEELYYYKIWQSIKCARKICYKSWNSKYHCMSFNISRCFNLYIYLLFPYITEKKKSSTSGYSWSINMWMIWILLLLENTRQKVVKLRLLFFLLLVRILIFISKYLSSYYTILIVFVNHIQILAKKNEFL